MTGTTKARVLIVDDHPIVRRGLAELVGQQPDLEVCGEAEDLPEAVEKLRTTTPDLVIVDLSLRKGSGIDLIKQIRACNDDRIKILVSSMHDESLYAERVLRAGATGYINKQEATDKLTEAIRQVLAGGIYLSSKMTERLLQRSVGRRVESSTVSPLEQLTDRELQVFELIGKGLTTREIAAELFVSPKTVETHRENIKSKLGVKNSTELNRRAVQWVLERD